MEWKDKAIETFASSAFELLIGGISSDYSIVILVCDHGPGVVAASAIYYDKNGAKKGVENFFDVADALKAMSTEFHSQLKRHGEDFQCAKLTLDSDNNLEIEFDYHTMNKWDLADKSQFPAHRQL
jgi:hypothetical protein